MIGYMIWLFTVTYIGCIQKLYSKYCTHIYVLSDNCFFNAFISADSCS